MFSKSQSISLVLAVTVACILHVSSYAQNGMSMAASRNVAEMKFIKLPGLPTCSSGSVQNGDPMSGPAIILLKIEAGCAVPWHWHTSNEHLMIVSGEGVAEMKDGKPVTLQAGGFATMPGTHVHQFKCLRDCMLYLYTDGAFDLHYVDTAGKEITPDVALKAVKETPATMPK